MPESCPTQKSFSGCRCCNNGKMESVSRMPCGCSRKFSTIEPSVSGNSLWHCGQCHFGAVEIDAIKDLSVVLFSTHARQIVRVLLERRHHRLVIGQSRCLVTLLRLDDKAVMAAFEENAHDLARVGGK